MNNFERWGETIVGAAVAVVAIGFFVFAATQAGATSSVNGYELFGRFQRVNGVAVGTDVRISGVKVGVVRSVELDPETYEARVVMVINDGVQILDQSAAQVSADGLLGGAYIAIEPSGLDPLPPGGEIAYTEGDKDWLTLFAGFAQSQGQSQSQEEAPTP